MIQKLPLGSAGNPDATALQAMLKDYGYGVPQSGDDGAVVAAFQRHFRPARVDGIADASTFDTLRRLVGG